MGLCIAIYCHIFFVVELISGIVLSLVTESVALALTVHLLVISAFVVWGSPVKSNDMAREYEYKVISGIDELEIAVSAGRWADVVALSQRLSIVAGTRNRMHSI